MTKPKIEQPEFPEDARFAGIEIKDGMAIIDLRPISKIIKEAQERLCEVRTSILKATSVAEASRIATKAMDTARQLKTYIEGRRN